MRSGLPAHPGLQGNGEANSTWIRLAVDLASLRLTIGGFMARSSNCNYSIKNEPENGPKLSTDTANF